MDAEPVVVFKGPDQLDQPHPPNEKNIAAKLTTAIKRKVADHPEQPPALLLRTESQGQPDDVLSQFSSQPALPDLYTAISEIQKKQGTWKFA